ncbi:zinc finger C2HC domain-containing protein 1C [Electrophorus electricus]|uniref:zinc finger C2HC domain-containing protein 1C n=1 Tax=Electrophorus electricus TaxID=8005 RepID=UPI0015CF8FE0|nr:zinc finger C2HC domain-containing protein 1C [Electrophorus electricus]
MTEDWERKTTAVKDRPQESWEKWQNPGPIQRKYSPATSRHKMYLDEKEDDISMDKSMDRMDSIFPLKPVCHKRSFNLNNCQADNNSVIQKDQRRHYHVPCSSQSKQTNNKRQGVNDLSKLELFDSCDSVRGETNGKPTIGYQTLYKDQGRGSEDQIELTKEIHKKEIILQEKLLKAEQELRKVQLKTAFVDKVKREERRKSIKKEENRLYCNEKGNWDWESARERPLGGRKDEGQKERVRERDRGMGNKHDIEQWEKCERETNMVPRERRREGLQWGYSEKNKTRDYKIQEKFCNNSKEIKEKWEIGRKNETRREKAVEWNWNDIRELERTNWQGKGRVNSEENRRSERSKVKRDIEDEEEQQWKIIDMLKSNSHAKGKAFSKHEQINGLESDHWLSQERLYQHNQRAAEEMTSKSIKKGLPNEPSTEAAPCFPQLSQKVKSLQQVEFSPENSFSVNIRLIPCNICHRQFKEDRLDKHSSVCEKIHQSKRKTFDSSKYRAKGTDLENFMKTNDQCKTPELKKNNWRQKHEAFIRNLRQVRGPSTGDFQPQSSSDLNPDYITCPHCGRHFAPGPAERHIPKCQNIKSRPPPPRHRR